MPVTNSMQKPVKKQDPSIDILPEEEKVIVPEDKNNIEKKEFPSPRPRRTNFKKK